VLDGEEFERRFNDLRKVRSKVKASGTERPFSRMYNFYILEHGDKWARTGTKFRPRCEAGQPTPEILAAVRALSSAASTPNTPRTPSSATSTASSSRMLSAVPNGHAAFPASPSPKREGPPASPRVSARPHAAPRPVYEGEAPRSRPRDAPSAQRAPQAPAAASHVRAPPASPRHQPRMPPASSFPAPTSSRVLGKRPAADHHDDRGHMPAEQRARLSDQIYHSFRQNGMPVEAHHRPLPPSSSSHILHAAKVERYPFGGPSYHREEGHYKVHHAAVPFTTHAHSDFTTHDIERAQEQQQAHGMDNFVPSDMYRAPSPIEIDDASSGFPSPECLLAIAGDFVGSPLDLGDPELPLFGLEDDALGTSARDHTLLKQPYEHEDQEAWATLREVML